MTNPSLTHKREICGFEIYTTVCFRMGGQPSEVFVKVAKHGTEISGLLETIAQLTTLALQCGISWASIRETMLGAKYGSPDRAGLASSLTDGFAKMVDHCLLNAPAEIAVPIPPPCVLKAEHLPAPETPAKVETPPEVPPHAGLA